MEQLDTIVCVDDEKLILEAVKNQLREYFGNTVNIETAESGQEALALMEELETNHQVVSVMVCDQIMPGLKGDELILEVYKKNPAVLMILLTGQADAQAVGNIVNHAKLFRYMAKPWDKTDFTMTLREAMRSYKQDKTLEKKNQELEEINASLEIIVEQRTEQVRKQSHEIADKNIKLRETIDKLMMSRISRKATAFTLAIAVVLFLISEIVLDPFIESQTHQDFWIGLGTKLLIALALKPIDSAIERRLLHRELNLRQFDKVNNSE